MVCDFLPLMCATKPTPQASCSLEGWYSPWACKLMTELLNIQLLRCSDNGRAHRGVIDPVLQRRAADTLEHYEARFAFSGLLIERHQFHQPLGSQRRAGHWQSGALQQVAHPADFTFCQLTD